MFMSSVKYPLKYNVKSACVVEVQTIIYPNTDLWTYYFSQSKLYLCTVFVQSHIM